jgi:prepilin-type N-terminal cleavage/methylation domain-containing protein
VTRRPPPAALPRRGGGAAGGFTFIELLVVMSMMAVIMGLGIGFLMRVGKSATVQQAATILAEAGFECLNRSAGGRRATLVLSREADEEGVERIVVTQSVQRPALTMNFEDADWTFAAAGPATAKTQGSVRLDEAGWSGSCATFSKNGLMDFGIQAIYAPTDGVEIDVAVKPERGRGSMVVYRAEEDGRDLVALVLAKDALGSAGGQDAYKVQLRLSLVPADAGRRTDVSAIQTTYETYDAPVVAGEWNQIRAAFDGREASIRIRGVDHVKVEKRAKDAPPLPTFRLATPASGALRATASAERASFEGSMDLLLVSGIFRTDADRRVLRGDVDVATYRGAARSARLPHRVVWWNGSLDRSVHGADETIEVTSPSETAAWRVTYGLYGANTPAQLVSGAAARYADVTPGGR